MAPMSNYPTETMAGIGKDKLHVVILPWCAFGHIIPLFHLSKSLALHGVSVSFVSTPRNIQRLPKLPPHLEALVKLVELPMPRLENDQLLPEGAEATVDVLGMDSIQYLKIAYDLLQEPFKHYVASVKPDWIIVDFAPYWAADVAEELSVPLMMFSAVSASTKLFFGPPEALSGEGQRRLRGSPESLTTRPEWVDFPSAVAYRSFEAEAMHRGLYGENASGITDAGRIARLSLACRAMCIRSCPEVEGEYLTSLQKVIGRDVIPLGLLPPDETESRTGNNDYWAGIFKWLDEQESRSVVFVGFGSECKLTRKEVSEIARGLELSELPFLWALRSDADALPPGFGRLTAGRGVVSMGWAPQTEILGHGAIGGSLFHSGWGSVIETLQFGHTLVVLPFIIDQGLNARALVEKGLAVEVERSDDGSFTAENIAKSLRLAMVDEEGEPLRAKSREAGKVFGDKKLHQQYFSGFVDYLKDGIVRGK